MACQTIRAVDPVGRGIVEIPTSHVLPTRGLQEYLAKDHQRRDLSICCLFQQGRCKADSNCRQIHANRHFIENQRAELLLVATCCVDCRQPSPRDRWIRFSGKATVGMPELPTSRLIHTAGMPALIGPVTEIPWSSVCRLQLQDACKYGASCRNVHVCIKLGKHLLARAAMNVNAEVPQSIRRLAAQMPEIVPQVQPSTCIKAPLQLRAHFPRLDEGSLLMPNADLDGMVFALPTLASDGSDTRTMRCDLFSPSPLARTCCSPTTPLTHYR